MRRAGMRLGCGRTKFPITAWPQWWRRAGDDRMISSRCLDRLRQTGLPALAVSADGGGVNTGQQSTYLSPRRANVHSPILVVHICAGAWVAVRDRGDVFPQRFASACLLAGKVFVASMLTMGAFATYLCHREASTK